MATVSAPIDGQSLSQQPQPRSAHTAAPGELEIHHEWRCFHGKILYGRKFRALELGKSIHVRIINKMIDCEPCSSYV